MVIVMILAGQKSCYLKDLSSCYIQHFLAYNYSGRKDSSETFSKPKFFFIWCMTKNIKVNLSYWLVSQFKMVMVKKNKPLILGSYITHLAIHLDILDPYDHDLHLACNMDPLDMVCLEKMGVVEQVDDAWQFTLSGPTCVLVRRPSTCASTSSTS